ncbi:hypothetical protein D920_03048 [Enterococcus faecalis 13-SD-W-01]|nr:hypothetical protein D920_03048 [Enterococcus faecalis 13-SD-W-01]
MSVQLQLIIGATKLLNVKKIFTLKGQRFLDAIEKKQKKIAAPLEKQFKGYKKEVIEKQGIKSYLFSQKRKELIVYLAGGGFVLPISSLHWEYLDFLSASVQKDFFVLNYPLVPAAMVEELMLYIQELLEPMLDNYESITLMGDSAGGNIALSYIQSSYNKEKRIKTAVALSPLVDFSMSNPEIKETAKRDTIVSPIALPEIRQMYAPDKSLTDPLISPMYGDFSMFDIIVLSGTRDITNPDTKKMAEMNPNIIYIEKKELPHVFMLYQMLPEAQEVNAQLIAELKREKRREDA